MIYYPHDATLCMQLMCKAGLLIGLALIQKISGLGSRLGLGFIGLALIQNLWAWVYAWPELHLVWLVKDNLGWD